MSDKCCNWSITINNPTDEDKERWACLKSLTWVKEVKGQLERGQEGTLHIQGMIKTQSVRFSQVKKALPRAHIEPARNATALAQYVTKSETRVASLPTLKVASQADVQNMIIEYLERSAKHRYPEWEEGTWAQKLARYEYELQQDWEYWTDLAVSALIYRGYYGVEFVMANNQVRQAFKKYFVPIIHRTIHARQTQSTPTQQSETYVQPPSDEAQERSSESFHEEQSSETHHEDI